MTSDTALNAFTKMDTHNITIKPEYSVFEMDGHNGTMHASLPSIEERYHYFPRVDVTHQSLFVPPLPEPRDGLLPRCDKAIIEFHKRYKYAPKTAFVIVTHAAACIGLARAAANIRLEDVTPAAPCGIYHLTRRQSSSSSSCGDPSSSSSSWQMDAHDKENSMNGYVKHLSDLGTSTKIWNHFYDKSINIGYSGPPNSPYAPHNLPSRGEGL